MRGLQNEVDHSFGTEKRNKKDVVVEIGSDKLNKTATRHFREGMHATVIAAVNSNVHSEGGEVWATNDGESNGKRTFVRESRKWQLGKL